MKLSSNAYRLLKLVDDSTRWAGDERPGTVLECFYVPQLEDGATGAGDASTFRSLERKGLIKSMPHVGDYAYMITEDGLVTLSQR
jgi:hypothetical protein